MSDKFNEQKDILLAIKKEISLLQQQVDYLIRNGQPLGLLDLDVLMNRTHTLYDKLCSINLGGEEEDEELPVGMEQIKEMFGIKEEEDEEELEEVEGQEENEENIENEENEGAYFIEEAEEEEEVAEEMERPEEPEEEPEETIVEEPKEEPKPDSSDDLGFILNFEPVFTTGDEIEMTISEGKEEVEDIEKPEEKEETEGEEIVYEPVVIGDMTDHDDNGFELEQPETVGERYQQEQEETVGERLQHGSVRDLQSAIGINDKFLFVNELFGGSMEKYNRSIENLNDLKTLNGALIYLNELRIELQWNSNNEAYKKLLELVHRKFES